MAQVETPTPSPDQKPAPLSGGQGAGAGAQALAGGAPTRTTRCIWRTDEWGNSHDALEIGSDVAIMVYFVYPRTVEVMYITEDFRVLTHHGDSRTAETFCTDTPLSKYASNSIGKERVREVCDAIAIGGYLVLGRLKVSVTLLKPGIVEKICGGK
jgi:hypothetical protein